VKVIVTLTVIIGLILTSIYIYLLRHWMAKHKGNMHIPLCSKKDPLDPLSCLLSSLYAHSY
jgi:hypothetical protein